MKNQRLSSNFLHLSTTSPYTDPCFVSDLVMGNLGITKRPFRFGTVRRLSLEMSVAEAQWYLVSLMPRCSAPRDWQIFGGWSYRSKSINIIGGRHFSLGTRIFRLYCCQ